ncbi:MAG: hypothetical protein ACR2P2_06700 [Nakamurella sp.]
MTAATVFTTGETILFSGAATGFCLADVGVWPEPEVDVDSCCAATVATALGADVRVSLGAVGVSFLAGGKTGPELAGAAFAALDGRLPFAG